MITRVRIFGYCPKKNLNTVAAKNRTMQSLFEQRHKNQTYCTYTRVEWFLNNKLDTCHVVPNYYRSFLILKFHFEMLPNFWNLTISEIPKKCEMTPPYLFFLGQSVGICTVHTLTLFAWQLTNVICRNMFSDLGILSNTTHGTRTRHAEYTLYNVQCKMYIVQSCSVSDPGPFVRIRIRIFFPSPDPDRSKHPDPDPWTKASTNCKYEKKKKMLYHV